MDAPPVKYVTTSDGYNIAYATTGLGRPLVLLPEPFSHIQLYWREVTFMLPLLKGLAERFRLVQYDGRGQGMSERGIKDSHSMEDEIRDLETMIERVGLKRFVLMARRDGAHVAVKYALRHPQQVSGLILGSVATKATPASIREIAEKNWDGFLGLASPTRAIESAASLQRMKQTTTQADFVRRQRGHATSDLGDILGSVWTPTLIIHPRDFTAYGPEDALEFAGHMPRATLVTVEGSVGWGEVQQGLNAIDAFVAGLPSNGAEWTPDESTVPSTASDSNGLSPRELEVLRHLAAGRTNPQIAEALVISSNTVAKHVTSILTKTESANRTEAAAYAHRHGLV